MSSTSVTTLSRANHPHSIAIGNGLTKLLCLGLAHVSHVAAQPLKHHFGLGVTSEEPPNADDFSLWLYLSIAAVLVLLGGAFAGLTIALMGQDGVYLQVIATSGEGTEQRHAQSVFNLLQKGKHWVLVTLLLSNVIVNESLPIVLDRSLGGGWPAVLGSTALIVIFGEVIPQSVCVRYGLLIGAYMAPFVLGLMWILAPIAWPIAKLLDRVLGKHHGTIYKKSGLKTLVTLHKTLGTCPTERLNQDEVTIISAVLDLKDKPVVDIMTPIDDVFTMSEDTVLDEATMNIILSAGYSRIPIYEPGNPKNFVGMLLVKILITYDPEDCKRVSEFALATLPETRPETSCLDIVNFFQEGKSHMVLVSLFPAENYGALGVVTLEDVIEELIGEEIIDESDVYIDVHKAIRRLAPAPKARVQKGHIVANTDHDPIQASENNVTELSVDHAPLANLTNGVVPGESPGSPAFLATSPKTTFLRKSSGTGTERNAPVVVRGTVSDMREHLKHLGPSNLASRPKSTRYNTVKIKSGHPQPRSNSRSDSNRQHDWVLEEQYHDVISEQPVQDASAPGGGERTRLLGFIGDADVGVDTCEQGYGSINHFISGRPPTMLVCNDGPQDSSNHEVELKLAESLRDRHDSGNESRRSKDSLETIGSRHSEGCTRRRKQTGIARSGSITENIIEAGGIQKLVLETNSSGEDGDQWKHSEGSDQTSSKSWPKPEGHLSSSLDGDEEPKHPSKSEETKKKRRKHRKKKSTTKDVYETDPTAGE